MGIVNVTPDSFSDGGEFAEPEQALAQARRMAAEGAAIIDVGGKSTRPGATPVSAAEEQSRILPVIEALAADGESLISVDTYRAETARLAVAAGAHSSTTCMAFSASPNRAGGRRDRSRAGHHAHRARSRKTPRRHRRSISLSREITGDRSGSRCCGCADRSRSGLRVCQGLGGKSPAHRPVRGIAPLGFPFLVGTSRKRLIRHLAGDDRQSRDIGTAATSVILRMKGADLFRVHNVAVNRERWSSPTPCANVRSLPSSKASRSVATPSSDTAGNAPRKRTRTGKTHGDDSNQASAIRLMEIADHVRPDRLAIHRAVGSPPRRRNRLLAGGTAAGARSLRRRAAACKRRGTPTSRPRLSMCAPGCTNMAAAHGPWRTGRSISPISRMAGCIGRRTPRPSRSR